MSTSNTRSSLTDSRPVYAERVNAVIDYIEAHLAEDPSLTTLAEVAHFSPYHFHRVFSTMVGETIGRFISRGSSNERDQSDSSDTASPSAMWLP